MARALWSGAITFGLIHLPVGLYAATRETSVDFQLLDRKSLDPVGYKRYNKRTGRELRAQDVVKGVKQPNGKYVVVTDDEIRAAFPRSTQTIEIDSFIASAGLPLMMLERPYYIAPAGKADKVYVLLRESMRDAQVAAVARIVIHNKEHLAAILAVENALVLEILRWAQDMRSPDSLDLPGKVNAIRPQERKMATQLIEQMTTPWKPAAHTEHFSDAISNLIRKKVAAGQAKSVEPLEQAVAPERATNILDLSELLAKSLRDRKAKGAGEAGGRGRVVSRRRNSGTRSAAG
jgi:DNA end-binding protein Ku